MKIQEIKKYIITEGLRFGNREKRMVDKMSRDIFLGFEFEFNLDKNKIIDKYDANVVKDINLYSDDEMLYMINNPLFHIEAWEELYERFFLNYQRNIQDIMDDITNIDNDPVKAAIKISFACNKFIETYKLFHFIVQLLKTKYDSKMTERILLEISFYTALMIFERLIYEPKYSNIIKNTSISDIKNNYDEYIELIDEINKTIKKANNMLSYDISSFNKFIRSVISKNQNLLNLLSNNKYMSDTKLISIYAPIISNEMIDEARIDGGFVPENTTDAEVVHEHETFNDAINSLSRFLAVMRDNNIVYTDENTGLHCNLSIKNTKFTRSNINRLKLTVLMQERRIDPEFPEREYVKSMIKAVSESMTHDDWKWLLRYALNGQWERVFNVVEVNIPLKEKYQRVNFQHLAEDMDTRRIEFRFPGGKDYEYKEREIIDWLYRMVYMTMAAYNDEFGTKEYIKEAYKYLDEYLVPYNFKNFNLEQLIDYYARTDELPNYDDHPFKQIKTRIRIP